MARERLNPADVGLKSIGRRRTPGLRREEVAQLAAVSLSWYTNIEQGNDVQPSDEIISALITALRLSADEQRYVYSLLHAKEDSELMTLNTPPVDDGLHHLIDTLDPNPSYVLDANWDVIYWNHGAERLFGFPEYDYHNHHFNLLQRFLTNTEMQQLNASWQPIALSMIARFRLTVADHIQESRPQQIIANLRRESSLFADTWDNYTIEDINTSVIQLTHPELGQLVFQYVSLELTQNPTIKVMTFVSLSPNKML